MREIYDLNFDASSFVTNVEKAITVTGELDSKLKAVSEDANKVSFNKPISELSKLKTMLSDGSDMKGFDDIFKNFEKEIPKIKKYLEELKQQLAKTTNKEEFNALTKVIQQTEKAIAEATGETKTLAKETENLEKKQGSLRQEIRKNTVELQNMERQGKENTKEYKNLQKETAELIDSQGDLQGALRKMSSDTYKVDLGIEGIQVGIGAYQTYLGVMGLVGNESNELQETMTKLLAVQQVAEGIQEIATFLTNEEGLALALKTTWTKLSTIATIEATGAQKAMNIALLSTGIGAVVVGLGLLVANWEKVSETLTGVTAKQKLLSDINKKANEGSSEDIARLRVLTGTVQDNSLSIDKRRKAVTMLKDEFPTYFKNLKEEKLLHGDITKEIDLTTRALYQKAKAQAVQEQLKESIKAELNLLQNFKENKQKLEKKDKNFLDNIKESAFKDNEKIYAKEYIELKKQQDFLLKQSIKSFEGGELTMSESKDKKEKEKKEKAKNYLIDAEKVQDEGYKKAIENAKSYYEKLADVEDGQNNELRRKKIDNITDALKRETELLDLEREIQKKALEKAVKENEENLLNFISVNPAQKEEAEKRISDFAKNATEIQIQNEIEYQNKKAEIQKKALAEALKSIKDNNALANSEIEREQSAEILALTEKYNKGLIKEDAYQKELSKIERKYNNERKNERLAEIDKEITNAQDRLNAGGDKTQISKEINDLLSERDKILTEADKKTKVSVEDTLIGKIFGIDPTDKSFAEDKAKILGGLKDIVSSSIAILKEQTRAELEAYDLAIKLQQDRVSKASKIAENGNAEYLQLEEERLTELEAKREASARRQLEIDSAIQASQMLVAIAGAVAQISQGGIANVIAGIGTITATIATGYALMNQLNASRPQFYSGTETTVAEELGKPQRSGRDGYDISVDGSEMIVNGKITKELRKRGVKASDLPTLVSLGQRRINEVGLQVAKVEAMENMKGLESRLDKSEKIQKQMLGALKQIKVSANIDSRGVASIVSNYEMDKLKSKLA